MAQTKVEQVKEENSKLQEFVNLAESYRADNVERCIIREYAYYNSIPNVIKGLREKGITNDGKGIERQDVIDVLRAKPVDDLHRIIQSWYKQKVKGNRRNGKQAMLMSLKSNKTITIGELEIK